MKLSYLVGMFFQVKGVENMFREGEKVRCKEQFSNYFSGDGEVVYVTEGTILVRRDDGKRGGGPGGEWIIMDSELPCLELVRKTRNVFQGERQMKHA